MLWDVGEFAPAHGGGNIVLLAFAFMPFEIRYLPSFAESVP